MKHEFEKYCKDYENIENYDKALKDNFKGWDCHHRREVEFSRKELKALDMYYNRPPEELIFLTVSEHRLLHNKGNKYALGCKRSTETRKKLSEAKKGEKNPFYGKTHSEKTRRKISEVHKGKHPSTETRKKMSEVHKGKPKSAETRKKMSEAKKGRHWYNNGEKCVRAKECPLGFVPGLLKIK